MLQKKNWNKKKTYYIIWQKINKVKKEKKKNRWEYWSRALRFQNRSHRFSRNPQSFYFRADLDHPHQRSQWWWWWWWSPIRLAFQISMYTFKHVSIYIYICIYIPIYIYNIPIFSDHPLCMLESRDLTVEAHFAATSTIKAGTLDILYVSDIRQVYNVVQFA